MWHYQFPNCTFGKFECEKLEVDTMAILEYLKFDHGQNCGQNGQKNGQNLWSKI